MTERLETFVLFTTTILYQLGNKISGSKDIYSRNSIAKVQTLVKSIELLCEQDLFNEGWILYRCLIDRYIHLRYLFQNDLHEDFKKWSIVQGYKYNQNAKSDELFKEIKNDSRFQFTKDQTQLYNASKNNKYTKPKPKNQLKKEGFDFIYKLGYDHASMRVHPMFEDGNEEYYKITKIQPNPFHDFNNKELNSNTYLIATMILQEALNQIDLKKNSLIYDVILALRENSNFKVTFYNMIKHIELENELFVQ